MYSKLICIVGACMIFGNIHQASLPQVSDQRKEAKIYSPGKGKVTTAEWFMWKLLIQKKKKNVKGAFSTLISITFER
jgi:hypothetical protein